MKAVNLQRLRGFLRKEWLQIFRDPSSIVVGLVLPIMMLFLLGYGISLDARNQPAAVVMETSAPEARDFLAALRANHYVVPHVAPDRPTATAWLRAGKVAAIIVFAEDFGERLNRGGDAPIQVLVNGTDANTARLLLGYTQGVWATWLVHREHVNPGSSIVPVNVEYRVWFNESLASDRTIVPGLIAVIMTMIGTLLTSMVIAREWERGTMEALLTTPLTRTELILGKLIPYYCLGMGGMAISVVCALTVFGLEYKGSVLVLVVVTTIFMLVTLGIGLAASTATRNQFSASTIALSATMMPGVLLSGFIFDIRSMVEPVQIITHIVPSRYLVSVLQTLFLVGDVWPIILQNTAALAVMAVLFITITARKTRRNLE